MIKRTAKAVWSGNLREGNGVVKLGSGLFEGPYTFVSRFEAGRETNPEELLGAAHAGCFSMALSAGLTTARFKPKSISTTASVYLDKVGDSFRIVKIELETEASVPDITPEAFNEQAGKAKKGCPLSVALTGTEIVLRAKLV